MITASELREVLHYDPLTGVFRWKTDKRGHAKKGDEAGTQGGRYAYICINQKTMSSHRLAWLYVHGVWPSNEIDHIDRDTRNNAIDNLRDTTRVKNTQNTVASGASINKRTGKWIAQIVSNGRRHYLGSYETRAAAELAYSAAKRALHLDCPLADGPASEDDLKVFGRGDGIARNNTSGVTGVSYKAKRRKFEAHIRVDGRYQYVGAYDDLDSAVAAREAALAAKAPQ